MIIEQDKKKKSVWSRGMIPALGAGGPGFKSRNGPFATLRAIKLFLSQRLPRQGHSFHRGIANDATFQQCNFETYP